MAIRWVDKLTVLDNGDIVDFNGQVVGHINIDLIDFDNEDNVNADTKGK